jgi:hypothetical protein
MQLGKTSLVVGLAALSFNSATREQMPTLQPPDKAAYLSNIAVEPHYRRYDWELPSTSKPAAPLWQLAEVYCPHITSTSCQHPAQCACHDKSNLLLLTWLRWCRKGIASVLLKVCEQVTQDALLQRLYLHARIADVGAQAFYKNAGYLEEGRDGSLTAMWHRISPRVLLCKALPVVE